MSRDDFSDEESRTITIGTKHVRTNAGQHHTSKKPARYRHRVGHQDLRDFVPRGGSFDSSPLPESKLYSRHSSGIDQRSAVSESSGDYQIPQSTSRSAMNWNNSSQGSIRTSLRGGGDLGQNRLATGFRPQPDHNNYGQVLSQDVVEISDDSEMGEDSEGGILLNVDGPSSVDSSVDAGTPPEISDSEDGEITDNLPTQAMPSTRDTKTGKQHLAPESNRSGTLQAPSQNNSNITTPLFQIDARRGARILADLTPEDLEKQIKYTLFHLRRDQIDLSRPVICIACLNEGHTDQYCPGLLCSICGPQTKHPSRLCPKRVRCSKCRDRGHNAASCKSKLKNPNIEPCDFCGGADHVEASCIQRFFPARTEIPEGELRLWISCAQCGSKDHLAGDCPAYGSKPANEWSLRTYSRNKIVNLSLQAGAQAREKEAQSRGIRPEGMQIKGRGAPTHTRYPKRGDPAQSSGLQFEGDDDFTTRIAANRSRRPSPPRNHIRFGDDDRGRMNGGRDDDYYRPRPDRPRPSNDYKNYPPPPSHEYRDRNGYGGGRAYQDDRDYHSRRPRSRSPSRFEGDTWRPPSVSLPARPAAPRSQQQSQNQSQNSLKKGKRGGGKAKSGGGGGGGGGGKAVKPMPSAAKNAWNRGRL
jgi:protein AIR1/2